jgi:hypothetical protein
MKYLQKVQVVDTVQWKRNNKREMFEFLEWTRWDKLDNNACGDRFQYNVLSEGLYVSGNKYVNVGDYVVKTSKDELMVYSESEFNETFELPYQPESI